MTRELRRSGWFRQGLRVKHAVGVIAGLTVFASGGSEGRGSSNPMPPELKSVTPGACMPLVDDYSFLWWAHGWRGRSPDGRKVLCIQTGRYGLAIDTEKLQMLNLGLIERPKRYEVA